MRLPLKTVQCSINPANESRRDVLYSDGDRLGCFDAGEANFFVAAVNSHNRYKAALEKIVTEGDYTAPEAMKRIAREALAA